jgi:hypothetical protein
MFSARTACMRQEERPGCDSSHSALGVAVLSGGCQGHGKTGVGIMTQKIKLDRYDLVIAGAIVLFAVVAISLVLT